MRELREFLRDQRRRAGLRVRVLWCGVISAVFWTVALALWTVSERSGFSWLPALIFAAYLLVTAPLLAGQAILIADLIGYVIVGKIFAYPALMTAGQEWQRANPGPPRISPALRVIFFLADASPLSALAVWALVVLSRMPSTVHASEAGEFASQALRAESARRLRRSEIAIDSYLLDAAVKRLTFAT